MNGVDWHTILELTQMLLTLLVIPLIKVLLGIKVELAHFNATVEGLVARIKRIEEWQDNGRRGN